MSIAKISMAGLVAACALSLSIVPALSDIGPDIGRAQGYLAGVTRTAAPFAHVVFCARFPAECISGKPAAIEATARDPRQLQDVNSSVNARIAARNDAPGTDEWSLDPTAGDCEDYAITKRHELLARGWPAEALRLATAVTRDGVGHMVLVATTDTGDVVLDNRTDAIVGWRTSGLRFLAVQSRDDPRVWLRTRGQAPSVVAARAPGEGSK